MDLHKIISLAPGIVYQFRLRLDGSTCVPYASKAIREIYRLNPEEIREDASKVFIHVHPDDLENHMASIQASARDLTPWQNEYRLKFDDGTVRWLYGNALPQREADGSTLWHGFITDITERKNSEERLLKSEEKLRAYLDNISDTIWLIDTNLSMAYVSPSVISLLGVLPGELIGRPSALVIHPDDMDIVTNAQCYVMEHPGEPHTVQYRVSHKDGRWIDVESTGVNMLGNPVINGVLVTMRDITERKQAEQILAESESRFREIFNTVSDAIFIHDTETGRIVDVNRRMCEMYGVTREEVIACGPDDLSAGVPPYSSAEAIEKIRLARTEGPQTFDWLARARDGRFFWVEVSLRFAHIGNQQRILAVVRDISERKHMDMELRIAAIAFESQDGMVITDANSVILRVNRAFTEITGYTAEEAVGQTPRLLKSGSHDTAFYAAMWESIRHTGTWHGEIWNRRKSGEIYPEQLTITAVKGDRGEATHYVATLCDITERKAAEEEIYNLAFYDALTKLPNRRLLGDRLGQAMAASKRSGLYGALMFLDLDNFKPLNDTYGHDVGDLLLMEASRRIASCVREVDTVARFGGDEFVVMLSELDADKAESTAQAGIVAEKIRTILAEPYLLACKQEGDAEIAVEHHCTSSIGVALFLNHKARPEDVIKWADMAMYQAKEGGRNLIRFFDSES
ncbi:MAG: PAS domain S-box protein [Gallionella sp.]|nr:PAS domain S-box protein [Gallionella sp.]